MNISPFCTQISCFKLHIGNLIYFYYNSDTHIYRILGLKIVATERQECSQPTNLFPKHLFEPSIFVWLFHNLETYACVHALQFISIQL